MSDNPIKDIRVVQKLEWIEQDDGTKKIMPTNYSIQFQRVDSESWEDVSVVYDRSDLGEESQ